MMELGCEEAVDLATRSYSVFHLVMRYLSGLKQNKGRKYPMD